MRWGHENTHRFLAQFLRFEGSIPQEHLPDLRGYGMSVKEDIVTVDNTYHRSVMCGIRDLPPMRESRLDDAANCASIGTGDGIN